MQTSHRFKSLDLNFLNSILPAGRCAGRAREPGARFGGATDGGRVCISTEPRGKICTCLQYIVMTPASLSFNRQQCAGTVDAIGCGRLKCKDMAGRSFYHNINYKCNPCQSVLQLRQHKDVLQALNIVYLKEPPCSLKLLQSPNLAGNKSTTFG